MSDLIDRQAVIDAINSWRGGPYPRGLIEAINNIPAEQPERKTGRWVKWTRYTIGPDYMAVAHDYTCSECGADHRPTYDYCPSCGSRNEIGK